MITFKRTATQINRGRRVAVLGQICYTQASHCFQTNSTRHLSLAYALHEPPLAESAKAQPAIIIMHGLFGSKQNNRGISKYGSVCASAEWDYY